MPLDESPRGPVKLTRPAARAYLREPLFDHVLHDDRSFSETPGADFPWASRENHPPRLPHRHLRRVGTCGRDSDEQSLIPKALRVEWPKVIDANHDADRKTANCFARTKWRKFEIVRQLSVEATLEGVQPLLSG